MRRKAALAAGVLFVVVASGLWLRARAEERCPDAGMPNDLGTTVAGTGSSLTADVVVGTRRYAIEPHVMADFGAYVRPFPVPESHRVGVSVTVRAATAEAVLAWRTTCLRARHGRESVERPAITGRDIMMGGEPIRWYRFDGANGYPEWPPDDSVDLEITALVDGSAFLIRVPGVPIVRMG